MFQLIDSILHQFRDCFKREKTWRWFVILILGLMIRNDHRGVTSVVSSMRLKPHLYHTILHYFRSKAYSVKTLYEKWIKIVVKHGAVLYIAGRIVLLGDHSKVAKEGLRMPGIQILHQDSQNSGKPEFIAGHNYGQVSVIITNGSESRSLPLMTRLQEPPPKQEGKKQKDDHKSLVAQEVSLINETAISIGEPVVAALDAYFSSRVAWETADKSVVNGVKLVELVTRAKSDATGFTVPEPPKVRKPGQPRIYGDKIKLYSLFSDMSKFKRTRMVLYGKETDVAYLCLDLLWRPIKKLVRFVAVKTEWGRIVLMSSSLTLTAEEIITVYCLRFKIETSFAEQKNDVGCFTYHFWTAALPKRKKRKKAEDPSDEMLKQRVDSARQATDSFVCLGTIATGILSLIAFNYNREIWQRYSGWLRTRRSKIPSAATVKSVLAQDFHDSLPLILGLPSFAFIMPLIRHARFLYQNVA